MILTFFIFNPIPSFKGNYSQILVKICQFKFLVMTEKNIFIYKLFLLLNISGFSLFFMQKLQPSEKNSPPLSWQPPIFSFSEIWLEAQLPMSREEGGAQ